VAGKQGELWRKIKNPFVLSLSKHSLGNNNMKPFYVYILKCSDNSYYTGQTDDIEKRLAEHINNEKPTYTSTRLPIQLVFIQEFMTREEAIAAERQIQGWSRKKKEALIARDWDQLRYLSNLKKNT
jgi:predicted GIY-YIG superfamily endonuclease